MARVDDENRPAPETLQPEQNFFDQDILREPLVHGVVALQERGVAVATRDTRDEASARFVRTFEDLAHLVDHIANVRGTPVRRVYPTAGGEPAVLAQPNDFLPEGRRRPYWRSQGRTALREILSGIVAELDRATGGQWADYVATQRMEDRYTSGGAYIPPEADAPRPVLPQTYRVWSRPAPRRG